MSWYRLRSLALLLRGALDFAQGRLHRRPVLGGRASVVRVEHDLRTSEFRVSRIHAPAAPARAKSDAVEILN